MTPARTRRLLISALALLLASSALTMPSWAQSDPDEERERARARQDEVAAELDLLEASDAELDARFAELETQIDAGETAHQAAVTRQREAEAEAESLAVEVRAAERRVGERRSVAQERAVAAYVHPRGAGVEVLLGTEDLTELHEKSVMVRQVAEWDRDVLEALMAAEQALEEQRSAAEAARTEAESARAEADAVLAALRGDRAELEDVRSALRVRIAEFEDEVDALAAQEAELTSLIARQQAAARATTTTTAPAPAVSDGPTGGGGGPTTTVAPPSGGPLVWPVSGTVTSLFGWRWGRMHNGIDIGASTGTPIGAAGAGVVFFAGWMSGYGNTVLVDHGSGMTTLYAHQSQIRSSVGQSVSAGQTIGLVGSTGNSTGPHLHFEVRLWGTPNDPLGYLP